MIYTTKDRFLIKTMILCGDLFADRLAQEQGVELQDRMVGFQGDCYDLTGKAAHKVPNLICPVPNLDFSFLGVHFKRMVNEGVAVPMRFLLLNGRAMERLTLVSKILWMPFLNKGIWQLFQKNWRLGLNEYKKAFSKNAFTTIYSDLYQTWK